MTDAKSDVHINILHARKVTSPDDFTTNINFPGTIGNG